MWRGRTTGRRPGKSEMLVRSHREVQCREDRCWLQSTEHSLKLSLCLGQRSSRHVPWSLDQQPHPGACWRCRESDSDAQKSETLGLAARVFLSDSDVAKLEKH